MNKKFLLVLALVFGFSLVLAGCGESEEEDLTVTPPPIEEVVEQPATTTPAETTPTADIDSEIQNIDSTVGAAQTTGFEATGLSDQDLGL